MASPSDARSANTVTLVQVSVAGVNNTPNTQSDYVIVALDSKGRVWEMMGGRPWYCIQPPSEPEDSNDQPV